MYLTEYQRITVDSFMGLWNRGSLDDVPQDHASDIRNMQFERKRETKTRLGAGFSHVLPNGRPVVRMFDCAFVDSHLFPLACDGIGNLWRLDNYTVALSHPGMIDFDALNMNGHVYIAPMRDPNYPYDPTQDIIYVWADPAWSVRPAAGLKPPATFTVTPVAVGNGNVGPGYYGVAISYVYDTGYVTPPSDVVVANFPANSYMQISGIPGHLPGPEPGKGPNGGVVGYLIMVTKAQNSAEDATRAALYELTTNKNVSASGSTIVENFFDTDLVILATADPANGNLLNSMPRLPSGGGLGSVALIKYHGRMIIIGPNVAYDPDTGNATVVNDGRIFVSHPGAPENFDDLTGYLIIQSEFDGNIPRTGFELFGTLYITKAVGTFGTQDNGSDPNDPTNPWIVNMIDGGIGAYHHAVGTISGTQPSLSFNSTAFLANRNGLFIFNGNVLRPELTWKIRALWATMPLGAEAAIRVAIDIFNDLFYVMLPTTLPSPLGPNLILLGDYSLGLDSNNIRWSIYVFPWVVHDLMMAAWDDPLHPPPDFYYLRLGSDGIIYRLTGETTADEVWFVAPDSSGQYSHSVPIDNYYQLAPLAVGDLGSLNIARFIRYRMAGQGTLFTTLQDQGEYQLNTKSATNVSPDPFPGNYRDIGIQTNFTNEKVIVKFEMNGFTDFVRMARVDIFGKARWPTRPNA